MEKSQENKNILVTGVSKGLGFEICKLLLSKSYNVYGLGRTSNTELETHSNFKFIDIDLVNTNALEDELKQLLGNSVRMDGFVNK